MQARTTFTWTIALVIVAIAVVILNDRHKARVVRRARTKGRRPAARYLNYKTSWGLVLSLLIGTTLVLYAALMARPFLRVLPIIVVAAFLAVAFGKPLLGRWRHRELLEAARMCQEGDVEGAIARTQEFLEQRGPSSVAYSNLAMYWGLKGNWEQSLEMIRRAESLPRPPQFLVMNKGVALWKLGRAGEARRCLEQAVQQSPDDLLARCNYGMLLAETGDRVEAAHQLQHAERLSARQIAFPPAARRAREQSLDALRRALHADVHRGDHRSGDD